MAEEKASTATSKGNDEMTKWLALAGKHRKIMSVDGARFCYDLNEGKGCRSNCSFDNMCSFCGRPDDPMYSCRNFKDLNLQ